ncbi:helix-turn-helix transcriptional regulator [Sutcliffiella horikoshii]|uniref:helix-turn-helix transcriptional regulator n=1 Tax=Sutcliffiella horikoshii TaxID=79883 RepID=UPI001CBBD5B2|nr:helix-turn-helix transcriptional regulator [Sutcliffiella horikoshii]UAL46836.1 helix-turn-helix transcriptional regulator [Sutcliffiella horikoshii]
MKNRIKYLRKSEGFDLTQQQLAEALNVSRQTIVSIENGGNTTAELMLRIANFFDKDPRDIFFASDVVHVEQKQNQII